MVGKIFPLIDNCLQTNSQEALQQLKDSMLRTQEAQQHQKSSRGLILKVLMWLPVLS